VNYSYFERPWASGSTCSGVRKAIFIYICSILVLIMEK
jgi:hypothetical protein